MRFSNTVSRLFYGDTQTEIFLVDFLPGDSSTMSASSLHALAKNQEGVQASVVKAKPKNRSLKA